MAQNFISNTSSRLAAHYFLLFLDPNELSLRKSKSDDSFFECLDMSFLQTLCLETVSIAMKGSLDRELFSIRKTKQNLTIITDRLFQEVQLEESLAESLVV